MIDTHLSHRLVLLQSLLLLWNDQHLLQLLGRLLGLWHHHSHHLLRLLRHLLRRTCSICDIVHLVLNGGVPACWHHDVLLWDLSWWHLDGDRNVQNPSMWPPRSVVIEAHQDVVVYLKPVALDSGREALKHVPVLLRHAVKTPNRRVFRRDLQLEFKSLFLMRTKAFFFFCDDCLAISRESLETRVIYFASSCLVAAFQF